MLSRRTLLGASAVMPVIGARAARAQGRRPQIKIGVMNDMSGPYRDVTGTGSVACVQHAVRQFSSTAFDVEVLMADHQNKPDVGASIARQWFDQDRVDVIMDVPTSSVALAVNTIAREKNRLYINTGAGSGDLTGAQCTPVTIHWAYDTYMLAKTTVPHITKLGGDKWFFVTADYVFGHQLARDSMRFVRESGGKVMGEQRYAFPSTTDFSSVLLTARASGANVIGPATPATDTINCVKQANEFGFGQSTKIAALLMLITDVKALGLDLGAGLFLSSTFYWDADEGKRRFTKAVQNAMPNRQPPNRIQAGCYAGALHYLKTLAAMGADKAQDGAVVCAQMKKMPTEDDAFGKNAIRQDGLCVLPANLYQVKTPEESRGPWDLQKVVAHIPGEEAWMPQSEAGCKLASSG